MDRYDLMAEFLQDMGRGILWCLAILLSGIALGLLASLTPAADWVAALADKFVWLVEFVL